MARLKTEGTKLQLGDAATPTEVFTDVAQLESIEPPELSAEEVDQTELASAVRKSRPSAIPDAGEASLTVAFDPEDTQHTAIEALFRAGTNRNWRIVYNSGDNTRPHDTFPAWIKSFKVQGIDKDSGDLMADLTLRLTGLPVRGTTTLT